MTIQKVVVAGREFLGICDKQLGSEGSMKEQNQKLRDSKTSI